MSEPDFLGSSPPKIGVLIVEPEAQVRALLKLALEPHGYDLLLASTCQEGLTLVQQRSIPIPLVLLAGSVLDFQMEQTLATFRAFPPPCSILVMTGDIAAHKPETLLPLGVTHVVKKPFRLADLIELLKQTLAGKG